MQLTDEIRQAIDNSVLCWLASVSTDGVPNVSPKEIFLPFGQDAIIIANIASPQTVANIKVSPLVCLSFVDILVQKGFQLKGKAEIIDNQHADFSIMKDELSELAGKLFPFASITKMTVDTAKLILAPRYVLYPDTCEQTQIENAKKQYGLTD